MKAMMARFEALVIENFKLQLEMKEVSRRLMDQDEYVQQVKGERETALDNLAASERKLNAALNDLSDKVHDVNQAQQRTRQAQQAERDAKDEITRLKQQLAKANAIPQSQWKDLADRLVYDDLNTMSPCGEGVRWDKKISRIKEFRDATQCDLLEAKEAIEAAGVQRFYSY